MKAIQIDSPGEDCSLLVGAAIGRLLEPGDVLALYGELGAGKTLLVRGIAYGLEVPDGVRVTSPTFTIINEYSGRLYLYHLDLYRISGPHEIDSLPWEESIFGNGVAAVEWPERLGFLLPAERIEIVISITGDESRRLRIHGKGEKNSGRMPAWEREIRKTAHATPCRAHD